MTTFQLHRDQPLNKTKSKTTIEKIGQHWFKIILAVFALHIIFNKDVNISVNFSDKDHKEVASVEKVKKLPASFSLSPTVKEVHPKKQTVAPKREPQKTLMAAVSVPTKTEKVAINPKWKASQFGNLSFILNRNLARKKGVSPKIVDQKLENCRQYVERFAQVAIAEQERFGIPASITLAQGLLETNAGVSPLANESNNHFGIKCRQKCKDCTCRNYEDDDEFDMFRVFDNAWASYREHSQLLSTKRYAHLKNLSRKDYKSWAHGLKKAGYATDKLYAKKLIRIIETLDLYQFDA